MTMTLTEQITEVAEKLPPEKQAELLDIARQLGGSAEHVGPVSKKPTQLHGLFRGMKIPTDDEITELRREAWGERFR